MIPYNFRSEIIFRYMRKGANQLILKIINTYPKRLSLNYSLDIFELSFFIFSRKKKVKFN